MMGISTGLTREAYFQERKGQLCLYGCPKLLAAAVLSVLFNSLGTSDVVTEADLKKE